MTLDTPTLPVFIPEVTSNLNFNPTLNLNQTIYSFQFSYDGFFDPSGQTYIIWTPQDQSAVIPTSFSEYGTQVNLGGYYNCYSFEYWLALINTQLITAFESFRTKYEAIYGPLPAGANAPQMAWDSSSQTARIVYDQTYLNSNATPIYFYMNAPLYNIFNSFSAIKLGYGPNGLNWRMIVLDYAGFNAYTINDPINPTNNGSFVNMVQEWSTVPAFSPITAVVFVSNTLPIVSNQLSAPVLIQEGIVLSNTGNNSNFQQIITDLVSDSGLYKPNLVYQPSAQYRLIDMTGNRPLSNLDISVFWRDKNGQLNPFLIGSGASATLKILFTKKHTEMGK